MVLAKKCLLQSEKVCQNYKELNEIFLKDFENESMKKFFETNPWNEVQTVY